MKTTYEDCRELTNELNRKLQFLGKDFIYALLGKDNEDFLYIEQIHKDLDNPITAFVGGSIQATYNCLIAIHSLIGSYPLNDTLNKLQ